MSLANFPRKRTRKCGTILLDAITFLAFLFLDFLDAVLCVAYKLLDEFYEGKVTPCYCGNKGKENGECYGEEKELSETLHGRENIFREMGFLGFARKWKYGKKKGANGSRGGLVKRWSDCGCVSCVSWMKKGNQKLHVL